MPTNPVMYSGYCPFRCVPVSCTAIVLRSLGHDPTQQFLRHSGPVGQNLCAAHRGCPIRVQTQRLPLCQRLSVLHRHVQQVSFHYQKHLMYLLHCPTTLLLHVDSKY